jgi:hypothetical protein
MNVGLGPDLIGKRTQEMLKNTGEAAKKAAKVAEISLAEVPETFEEKFSVALNNVGMQMQALGLRGQGMFGGLSNISAGLSSMGSGKALGLENLTGTLNKLGAYGQVAAGTLELLKTWSSFGGAPDLTKLSDKELNEREETLAKHPSLDQAHAPDRPWFGGHTQKMLDDVRAEQENRETGMSSGSQAFTSATTITEITGNAILATLDTSRALHADTNRIASAQLAVQQDMKFLLSVNAGTLLTFVGR